MVVWYIVIWIVLYLASLFDLIWGFLGFVSMNDTDIPWTGDLSCQVSKIPLACLLICSVCWRGKKRGVQAWESIFSPYIFCEGQSIELSHPWTKYSTRQRLNATWTGAIQEGYGLLGMERNGYVDFALPDKMFTEVSVNSRQIGSQELHIIFAQGCFNLVQKQFILIKQSFTPDNKMMSDMFTTTSWNHGILLFWCLNYVLFFHRPTDPS